MVALRIRCLQLMTVTVVDVRVFMEPRMEHYPLTPQVNRMKRPKFMYVFLSVETMNIEVSMNIHRM